MITRQLPVAPSTAGTALANGRPGTGRSFRLHRVRGGYCGAGWCHQCGVDPTTGTALCQTAAAAPLSARLDLLRPLGRLGERQLPWFWEHRFLRPRRLRGAFLATISRLSSAPPLPVAPGRRRPAHRRLTVEVLHIGDPQHADAGAYVLDAQAGQSAFGVYGERVVGATIPGEVLEIHCERLVLATGAYLRLPPIVGNDLPGVLSLDALTTYVAAGAALGRCRVAVIAPRADHAAITERLAGHVVLVDISDALPQQILGARRVTGLRRNGTAIACDAVVLALDQPAIELALMAGAHGTLSTGPLPVVLATDLPPWLELRGRAAGAGPTISSHASDPAAFVCPCEDVRIRDLAAAVASGLGDVELVKRRTGAMTGPCQGKLCQGAVLTALRDLGVAPRPVTPRPFARSPRLADLASDDGR